jgi:hypothetical protein
MKRLPRISRTGDFSVAWNQQIAPVLDENFREARIQPGIGCRVSSSPSGQSIIVDRNSQKQLKIPFDLILGAGEEGQQNITVVPGIVAGFLPDNIFDEISYSSGDIYVWAEITSSSGNITGVTLSSGTTTPSPQTASENYPPASLKILIGMVDADGNSFNFIGANWLTPYPVPAFSSTGSNYYLWRW